MRYDEIPCYRYYEFVIHEALKSFNQKDTRAVIFMNKMLGYADESSEADILCVGQKNNMSIGIVIECKNFKIPRQGEVMPYYGKAITRETLSNKLKKKRFDAYSNCGLDRIIALGVFNDDDLQFEQIDRGLFIVGSRFEFSEKSFEFPQDMPNLILVWNQITSGMTALSPHHHAFETISDLPLHPWHRYERDYPLGQDNPENALPKIDLLKPLKNIWEEDYDGWPYPED